MTGQLTTTFEGVHWIHGASVPGWPPVPFSAFELECIQGPTAPLVTPPACGGGSGVAGLTPTRNRNVLSVFSAPFSITQGYAEGSPCPSGGVPPFAPQVVAYPVHGNGGAYSPFVPADHTRRR